MERKKTHKPKSDKKEDNSDDMPPVERWPELYRSAILQPIEDNNLALSQRNPAARFAVVPVQADWQSTWLKPRRIKWLERAEDVLRAFTPGERFLLYILSAIFGLSALLLVAGVNTLATVAVPTAGGTLVEGEVGSARFLNPLLTLSGPDEDITALVYSGLMRKMADGSLVPDLAENYSISNDGRIYTFTLRSNALFHDGAPVTSADVVYTMQQAQNPSINSARRADWTGVAVSAPDERTVVFTLPRAYAPFIQNTTLGILPKHVWEKVSAEEFPFSPLNTHPVGSGPFKIKSVTTDETGAASRYDLAPFKKYTLGISYLKRISFVFFPNTDALVKALNDGEVDAVAGLSPEDMSKVTRNDISVAQVALPRVFGVFFNQSHNTVLTERAVRAALNAAVDKQQITQAILAGRGSALEGPIPPGLLDDRSSAAPQPLADITVAATSTQEARIQNAKAILEKGGWTFDTNANPPIGGWKKADKTLSFTMATADQPELVATAKAILADWEALGVQIALHVYPISELNTNIIRPRNYDALLFGEVVGPELDLYAFWHSSQRNDPGLNLAMYANPQTDALLSQARATNNENARNALYKQFEALLIADVPAIFLYAPDFLYIVPNDLRGIELGALRNGAERFENAYHWYMDTENVWSVFTPLEASTRENI